MKQLIVSLTPFGEQFFDCWINEDKPGNEGSTTAWNACLAEVRRADILLVLYNGHPGWSGPHGGLGICHAELQRGLATGAAKVFAIELPEVERPSDALERDRHDRFRGYYHEQDLFVAKASGAEDVLACLPSLLQEAVVELAQLGGRETRKGKYDTGDALDWSRQGFPRRKSEIEVVIRSALLETDGSAEAGDALTVRIHGADVLVAISAVPDAMSNAAAREMAGRPFHHDHTMVSRLAGRIAGPVHFIGVHKSVTEKQARDLLGQPDVSTVVTTFGVLAVDRVSKVQCFLLKDCRDETTTRHAIQRTFEWMVRSGEDALVATRSRSRARIVKAIANEVEPT